jgi:hypothetical protein
MIDHTKDSFRPNETPYHIRRSQWEACSDGKRPEMPAKNVLTGVDRSCGKTIDSDAQAWRSPLVSTQIAVDLLE